MGTRWLIAVILLLALFLTGTLTPLPSLLLQLVGWALVAMLCVVLLCVQPFSARWALLRLTRRGRRILETRKLVATAKVHGRRGHRSAELEAALLAIQRHWVANRSGGMNTSSGSRPDGHSSAATASTGNTPGRPAPHPGAGRGVTPGSMGIHRAKREP